MAQTQGRESGLAAGVYAVEIETYQVLYFNGQMRRYAPGMRLGEACYRCMGRQSPCPTCPLPRLENASVTVGRREDGGAALPPDTFAVRLAGEDGHGCAILGLGELFLSDRLWLEDKHYQAILQQTQTIVFEYDIGTGEGFTSSHISDYLAGEYGGEPLGTVFVRDGVLYPEDIPGFTAFREEVLTHRGNRQILTRLKCKDGAFRWHKISATSYREGDGRALVVGTILNVDEETRLRESLRRRAEYDTTTGVYNKFTFYHETEGRLRAQPQAPCQILRFDVERFKTVNELFGAEEGDKVLRYIGKVLGGLVRPGETYGRLGNDVFCLCVSRSEQEVVRLVEEINERVNEYPIDFNFILSTGIYCLPRYEGQPIYFLCDRAALAQKSVKGNYVNRYAFYEEKMGQALSREHFIIGSMRRALEQREFVMYLQPKYDMRAGRIFGAEALARWNHPKGGIISPGEFIPLFERNGFVIHLDEYMWDLACQTLRRWIDAGLEPVPISVNVSRTHLHDPLFCEKVQALVEKYRLDPRLLELEITESAYTQTPQLLYAIMERLQALGFTFSMDDFGSGYSSLNMLKDIPVDILKIDLNFLKESRRGKDAGRIILEATVHMAQKLELPVVVEGVETAEQASLLLQVGCSKAQGYYFDRPMPVADFERLLTAAPRADACPAAAGGQG